MPGRVALRSVRYNAAMLPRLPALVLAALLASGCAHRVAITSDPVGAEVKYGRKSKGVTPTEFTAFWWPYRKMEARVKVPGYRTVTVRLQPDVGPMRLFWEAITFRWRRLAGVDVRTEHQVVMVRRHGRVGTWTPEEAKRE